MSRLKKTATLPLWQTVQKFELTSRDLTNILEQFKQNKQEIQENEGIEYAEHVMQIINELESSITKLTDVIDGVLPDMEME